MQPENALLAQWPGEFARTVEMMTGSTVRVVEMHEAVPASLWWENKLTTDPPVRLLAGAGEQVWYGVGSAVLKAAGVESADDAEIRSTWLELLEQAASSVAGAVSTPAKQVESSTGAEASPPVSSGSVIAVEINGEQYCLHLAVAVEQSAGEAQLASRPIAFAAGAGGGGTTTIASTPYPAVTPTRTMDALLDVHLPVSISFGHARMPLKDVLKLTAGTVVELNRQPEDPVDIIVNDCVIARGEVVVVDGNYAVRIQSIVGRQDRLGLGTTARDKGRLSA